MTFIHPKEHRILSRIIFICGGVLLATEMAMVIMFYNRIVNLDTAIKKVGDTSHQLETQNAVLQQKLITSLDGSLRFKEPYTALVEEAHPEYFNSQSNKWVAASRY